MKYLFLFALFFAIPAHAEFGFDDGIRKPQSVVVAGDSVIDKMDDETETRTTQMPVEPEFPMGGPDMPEDPINPFSKPPVVQKPTQPIKKTVKKVTPVKVQRTIADDRIDDAYVQELMKKKFDFSNPIE